MSKRPSKSGSPTSAAVPAAVGRPDWIKDPVEASMSGMGKNEPKWGRVWRYEGKRGTVWRIRYRDAAGRRVLETLGKEPTWNRSRSERELRRRLVDVERDGYRAPDKITFAE